MSYRPFGKVPAYTDISHFRAPYKNAMIAGFGQNSQETPMTTVATPPPAPGGLTESQYVTKDEAGNRFLRAEIKPLVMETLSVTNTVFIGPGKVQLQRLTPEQIQAAATDPTMKAIIESNNAKAWVEREVKAGKVVFMSVATLFKVMSGAGQFDQYDQLASMEPGKEAQDAAQFPTMVVIGGKPGGSLMASLGGPLGIAVGVAAIGGIAMYLSKRKKGRRPSAGRARF